MSIYDDVRKILATDSTEAELRVLLAARIEADEATGDVRGIRETPRQRIQRASGLTRSRTFEEGMKRAVERGVITIRRRYEKGAQLAAVYTWKGLASSAESVGDGNRRGRKPSATETAPPSSAETAVDIRNTAPDTTPVPPTPQGEAANTAAKNQGHKRNAGKAPTYNEAFLKFFAIYPRKVKKFSAWLAWSRLSNEDQAAALATVAAFAKQRRDEDQKFTPHPATWLNRRQFEDPIPTQAPKVPRCRSMVAAADPIPAKLPVDRSPEAIAARMARLAEINTKAREVVA